MEIRQTAEMVCVADAPASDQRRSRLAAWLIPDLASFIACITLVYALVVFDGTRQFFRDSDAGWHIQVGEMLHRDFSLPRTDPFSFSKSGQPWFAWEWASDYLLAVYHGTTSGLAGVAGWIALLIALTTGVWFRLTWAVGGNFLLAGAFAVLMVSTTSIHWLARPHIFSWAFLLGFLQYLESGGRRLWLIALISAAWANFHASFFLAPVLCLCYALGSFVRPLIWDEEAASEWRWFGTAALVSLASTLINPYGWNLHAHVVRYLFDKELLDRVAEFQSFNFHTNGAGQILLTMLVAATGAVLAFTQRKISHAIISALFLVIALRSARGLPLLALAVLPLANGAITQVLRKASGLRPVLRQKLDDFFAYCDRLRAIDIGQKDNLWLVAIWVCLLMVLDTYAIRAHAGFPTETFPVKASEVVAGLPKNARILAPDLYGGYLIYRFKGERKVFFDGRSDFYGADFMKKYIELVEVRPGWQKQLQTWNFTHALLPNRYSLIPALEQIGWKRVYSDEVATLLEKP